MFRLVPHFLHPVDLRTIIVLVFITHHSAIIFVHCSLSSVLSLEWYALNAIIDSPGDQRSPKPLPAPEVLNDTWRAHARDEISDTTAHRCRLGDDARESGRRSTGWLE